MNLTDLLGSLSPSIAHRILRLLKIRQETFHAWVENMCPCGAGGES